MTQPEPNAACSLAVSPIGIARTPFVEKASTPRQPRATSEVRGTIELHAGLGYEHAVSDLESWRYIWVLFWFHLNSSWRPKVQPPRSGRRRGVFATRSPHRPNPIGLSAVELERIDGLVLHVRGIDLLDGTPVLDIKPYVAYADSIPAAGTGWLGSAPDDPESDYDVVFDTLAEKQTAFLLSRFGIDLASDLKRALALGPHPHPYRRIKRDGDSLRIALKEWRARFRVDRRTITILEVTTGYRSRDLATRQDPALNCHRAFIERFG